MEGGFKMTYPSLGSFFTTLWVGIIVTIVSIILVVKFVMKKSLSEAMDDFISWLERLAKIWEESFPKSAVTTNYPVYIGSNGYTVRDEVVNDSFGKLGKYFEIFFFICAYPYSDNVVIYEFKVYTPVNPNMSHRRLCYTAKQIAEGAVTEQLHNQGYHSFVIDRFIHVNLQSDTLRVYIATNNLGFDEIENLRKNS